MWYTYIHGKEKLLEKDKKLLESLKKGGRAGQKNFFNFT